MELLDREMIKRLEQLALVAKKLAHSSNYGNNISHRRGYSPEFSDFREYAEGDDLRFIDWNVYARLGKLYSKLFLAEDELHVRILLDSSKSMDGKYKRALQLTASLGYVALTSGNRVQIYTNDAAGVVTSAIYKNRSSIHNLFAFLSGLKVQDDCCASGLVDFSLKNHTVGTGLRILISDLFFTECNENLEKTVVGLVKKLAASKYDFHIVHLLSADEISPNYTGRKVLVDSENGHELKMDCLQLIKSYGVALNKFSNMLRKECHLHNGGYSLVNADDKLAEIITRLCKETIIKH